MPNNSIQMRWWAVFSLTWIVREVAEPGRFAAAYPGSWAARITRLSEIPPWAAEAWFLTAAGLIGTLALGLACLPNHWATRSAEKVACIGLSMGALGYAYFATTALRLDAPQVVETYSMSALMLMVQAVLIGCWYNSRLVEQEAADTLPTLDKEAACDASAL